MPKRKKNNLSIDFMWIITCDAEPCEDDRKYKTFLKDMYKSSTSTFLILKKEEEEFLKNYK
jgi:hypothetical protein